MEKAKSAESSTKGVDLQSRSTAIYMDLVRALQDAGMTSQKYVDDSARTYLAKLREVSDDVQRRYREAYLTYALATQQALAGVSQQPQALDAQRDFVAAAQNIESDLQKRLEQANREWLDAVQSGQTDVKNRLREAYRNYLRGQQELWASLDINALVGA
ncbi:MAG TPA: hypothetical protein VFQ79_25165 [Bryobacteraceae bacterium]|nr:hypothetical protein [Bryobacteraceae bacterium]